MRYLLPVLLFLAGCGCASLPSHNDLRATVHRLSFTKGLCSGTAISADTIITAQHCLKLGGALVAVDGLPVKVRGIGKDKRDTLTLRVTGITFAYWARMGPALTQGAQVRWWGSPAGMTDIYREGYVARVLTNEVLIDAIAFGGDSGSGIFDSQGRLIGVLTGIKWVRNGDGILFALVVMYPVELNNV